MDSYSLLTLCGYLVDEAPLPHPLKIHPKLKSNLHSVCYLLCTFSECTVLNYIYVHIYFYASGFVGAYLFYICVYIRHTHVWVCEYISILVMGYERNCIIFIYSCTNNVIFPWWNKLEGSIQHVKNIPSNEFQSRMKIIHKCFYHKILFDSVRYIFT